MKSAFLSLFIVALLLLQTGCTTININESHFLHPDKKISLLNVHKLNPLATIDPITLAAQDGAMLKGTLIKVPEARATIVYFGGNQFRISVAGAEPITRLLPLKVNILMVDHRGYGQSSGTPSVKNMQADALQVYDYLTTRNDLNTIPIILHGHSLGSTVAGYVASQRPIDGLVLEGSVTNVPQMVNSRIPWFAKPFVTINISDELNQVDNLKALQQYQMPLLIMTGEDDKQTPPALAESLYLQAKSTHKQLYIVKDKHHGNTLTGSEFITHYEQLLKQISMSQS
jgi:pimeloyl-ACP methyl ester carboxylesterase